jgi:hypothetical protein
MTVWGHALTKFVSLLTHNLTFSIKTNRYTV